MIIEINYYATTTNITSTKHRPPSRPRPRLVIDTVSIKLVPYVFSLTTIAERRNNKTASSIKFQFYGDDCIIL